MAGFQEKLMLWLGVNKREFDKGLKDAQTQVDKFASGIKSVGKFIAAAFTVTAITNFVAQSIKLSASMEGVKSAFDRLNSPNLLEKLRKATRGTVTDLQLMQKAVQAKNFKIPLEQLATYFEFATKRAIQTGESVDYLVDSIITGIGRKSVLVMDNLGISAVQLQEEVKKVGDFGKAAGNIIQKELGSMGDVADTTATSIAQIAAEWDNLKVAVGNALANSGLKRFLQDLATSIEVTTDPNTPWFGKSQTKKRLKEYRENKEYFEKLKSISMYSGGESSGGPLERIPKETKTIATLNEQLEILKQLHEQINIDDKEVIQTSLLKIDALEKEIKAYSELGETRTKVSKIEKLEFKPDIVLDKLGGKNSIWNQWADFLTKGGEGLQKTNNIAAQGVENTTEQITLQTEAVNILSDSFAQLFTTSSDGWKNMIDSMIDDFLRLIGQIVAKTAILTFLNAISGNGFSLATGFSQTMGSMGFTGYANGGIVFGPEIAMVGENATSSNPEVILPMNKLAALTGASRDINVHGIIKGKDIALALRRNG